ncbi:MAG: tetratricopeptide repeat protein [Planctomycetales bacterium]|nr:tetratricopeptide repeat protein [Planctomycetales bacterium]
MHLCKASYNTTALTRVVTSESDFPVSANNPFTQHEQPIYHGGPLHRPPTQRNTQVLVVLAVVACIAVLLMAVIAAAMFVGWQAMAGLNSSIDLPKRTQAFRQDQDLYNQSLARLDFVLEDNQDIVTFVDQSVTLINAGEQPEFSQEMFIEAVRASQHASGRLAFDEVLTLKESLAIYEPIPDNDTENYRILDVRQSMEGALATVDLLFYSAYEEAYSHQWFLVKEQSQWRIYDWQRMEYGRRASDEYASYVRGSLLLMDGYDNAMVKLGEASQLVAEGEFAKARQLTTAAENMRMLPADKSIAYLRTAYTWILIEDYDAAITTLKKISQPDDMWGVWPTLAYCYYELEKYDLALEAAERAEKQSPQHPNPQRLKAAIYDMLDQKDDAADATAKALRVCPDVNFFYQLTGYGRPQDLPQLLQVAVEVQGEYWETLLNHAMYDSPFAAALMADAKNVSSIPEGFALLCEAANAWSADDFEVAAQTVIQFCREYHSTDLTDWARQLHFSARSADSQFDKMFQETDNLSATLRTLTINAYSDELYADSRKLLTAVEALPDDSGWKQGLQGWLYLQLEEYDQSLKNSDAFEAWLEQNPDDETEWLVESVEFNALDCLVQLSRFTELLQRWPDDAARHHEMGDVLLSRADPKNMQNFLTQTSAQSAQSIELQRYRIQAELEKQERHEDACFENHRRGLEIAARLFGDDESYYMTGSARQYGEDLVWFRRAPPDELRQKMSGVDEKVRQAIIAGANFTARWICDSSLVNSWQTLEIDSCESEQEHARILEQMAEYWSEQGNLQQAIALQRKAIVIDEQIDAWRRNNRKWTLVTYLLRSKQFDEARQELLGDTGRNPELPDEAVIDLAAGDLDAMRSRLDRMDDADLTEWLDDYRVSPYLDRWAEDQRVQTLLKRVARNTDYVSGHGFCRLILSDSQFLENEAWQSVLQDVFGTSVSFREIPQVGSASGSEKAIAVFVTSGLEQYVVRCDSKQYAAAKVGGSLSSDLLNPVMEISIEVLDDEPRATQRLFERAGQLASNTEVAKNRLLAMTWNYNQVEWTGTDLAKRIAWNGSVPVDTSHLPAGLSAARNNAVDSQDAADGDYTAAELKRLTDAAPDDTSLVLVVSSTICEEAVPVQLVYFDSNSSQATVRCLATSLLAPLIRIGVEVKCLPYELRKP